MRAPSMVAEIRRLLAEDQLSQRKIATRAYAALDAHGRVVDHRWVGCGPTPVVDAVRIAHGYDRADNRL